MARLNALLPVKLSVMLACLLGVVICVRGMTVRRMCVVGALFVRILLMILGRLAMMLRSVLVMFRCGLMMFDYLLLGHGGVPLLGAWRKNSPQESMPAGCIRCPEG